MAKQLYYRDIKVGAEIPALVKHPTITQLVKWAGATDGYYEIHYDKDFAISHGLPGVVVPGALLWSFLSQMLTDWLGEHGAIRKLSGSFRGMHLPDEDVMCKGKVIRKYIQDGENYVECEIWVENARGEKTTPGMAVVVLPG